MECDERMPFISDGLAAGKQLRDLASPDAGVWVNADGQEDFNVAKGCGSTFSSRITLDEIAIARSFVFPRLRFFL